MVQVNSYKAGNASPGSKRAWPVTIVGLLLVLQGFFLFSLIPALVTIDFVQRPEAHLNMFFPEEGGFVLPKLIIENVQELQIKFLFPSTEVPIPGQVLTGLSFWWLCLPAFGAGILVLRVWRYAWFIALSLQIILLSIALYIYFVYHQPYVYLVMLYSILLVFYLNHNDVLLTFHYLRSTNT